MKNTNTEEEGVSTGVEYLTLTSPYSHRCDDPNYVSASKDVQSTSQSPNAALSATTTRVATSTNFAPPTHRFSILAFPLLSLITQAPIQILPSPEPQFRLSYLCSTGDIHFTCEWWVVIATFTTAPPHRCLYSSVDPPLQPTCSPRLEPQFFKGFNN
jgi:hypothetical protein